MNTPTLLNFRVGQLQSGNYLADLRLDPGNPQGEHHNGAAPTPTRAVVLASMHWLTYHEPGAKAIIERFEQYEAIANEFDKDVIGVTVDEIKALLTLLKGETR